MEIIVYETKDYDAFKRLDGNRDVRCEKKIIKSIESVGYIPNPIMVNEKMEVIDGQNRLGALKELGLPVHYYVVKGATIDTARALNLGRSNWSTRDYVKSYAEQGNQSYIYFYELMEQSGYSAQQLYGIVKNKVICNGFTVAKDIDEGTLTIKDKDHKRIEHTLECLEKMRNSIGKIKGSNRLIISGLGWCINIKGCDVKRLTTVINERYPLINPVVDKCPELFLSDISDLYNKYMKGREGRIVFDAIYKTTVI